MGSYLEERTARRRRLRKHLLLTLFITWWVAVGTWHSIKPMPPGTYVASGPIRVEPTDVAFLYDLTYADGLGQPRFEQRIFDEVMRIVDEAHGFIVADFFLLNELMGAAGDAHRPLSRELVERLIARKQAQPSLAVLFVTDPINDIYGGQHAPLLDAMRAAGIDVVITDLTRLRDSNPLYSPFWRTFVQWWGNSDDGGALPNPFTSDPAPITLRSWLALLNFKANHRKVIAADRSDGSLVALVTSANPHDASSAHSNVALRVTGELVRELVASEVAVARTSGWRGQLDVPPAATSSVEPTDGAIELRLLTERAIREHLLAQIDATRAGDAIALAMFYLADRDIVEALLAAAARDVQVRLVLDPNRDAFGRRKDGVPNRPVANELVRESGGRIEVRWYRTHGEQFHTKLTLIRRGERFVASLGSANLTRRNLGNYNLETNVALAASVRSPLANEMQAYFDRLWNNEDEIELTAPFGAYEDTSLGRYWRYRLMEATGLSTF
mgnify:CR=1 FL=1|jgi:phosphatidylserine/phosphatidylglycerophosphate/cardiolipin synthase-like enzyme